MMMLVIIIIITTMTMMAGIRTLLPWTRGKPMAWDVTVPDTYAESHVGNTATTPGAAANRAAQKKTAKYANLSSTQCLLSLCSGDSW